MRILEMARSVGQLTVKVWPGCCALPDVYLVLRLPSSAFDGLSLNELSLAVAVQSLRSTAPPCVVFAIVTVVEAVEELPAASRAVAEIVWVPLAADVVARVTEYGALVSSAPTVTPSSRN